MNNVVKNGLILGGINTLFFFAIYIIDIALIADWKVMGVLFVVGLALNFFFAFQLRAAAGGFMIFKQAFLSIFGMLAIAGIVTLLFRVVLHNVIDTSIPEQMREISIEQVEAVFETMGLTDQEAIDKALEEIDKQDFSLGIANFTKELLINLGMAAFFALIISLFVKKNPPLNYVKDEGLDDGQYDDI